MLESKGHWQNIDSSGALDLTFASLLFGWLGSERQSRSTDFAPFAAVWAGAEPEHRP
jgi:hypothetical protein